MLKQVRMTQFNEAYSVEVNASVDKDTVQQFQMRDKHWKYVLVGTCVADGNITFTAGSSALACGDLVRNIKTGTFAISVEDALVKNQNPVKIGDTSYLDVVSFTSSVALTNVMIIKLP